MPSPASRSASALACSPEVVEGPVGVALQRPSAFQSVSPCRTSSRVVTPSTLASRGSRTQRQRLSRHRSAAGIGLEVARLLAAEGATVVTSGAGAAVGEASRSISVAAGEPERVVQEVEARLGRVDCPREQRRLDVQRSFEELGDDDWQLWT